MKRRIRNDAMMMLCGLLTIAGVMVETSSASAICASSPTFCPANSSTTHELFPYNGSSPIWANANTVYLGSYGTIMSSCIDGVVYSIWDSYTGSYPSQLQADSHLCVGDGSDTVVVLTGNYNCGGITLGAFPYAGHALQLFGQAGGDRITGGSGRDDLCGGSGQDYLYGQSGEDRLDGHDNGDYVDAGYNSDYSWGDYYAGNTGSGGGDIVKDTGTYDGSGYINVLSGGSGESYSDCLDDKSGFALSITCGGTGALDYSPLSGQSGVSGNCQWTSSCSAPYWYPLG